MKRQQYYSTYIVIFLTIIFFIYGLCAIWRHSFIAIDGKRYFTVADDSLIALRYGWNLSHGKGLVWNAGEYVEGFTNLLWVLYSALPSLLLEKRFVPLFMQLSAIVFLLFSSLCFYYLYRACVGRGETPSCHSYIESAAFMIPLSYFPYVYWCLRGMETSLQGVLMSGAVLLYLSRRSGPCILGSVVVGMAVLARPDCIIPAAVIVTFRLFKVWRKELILSDFITELIPLACILCALTIFRYIYFGTIIPNTAVLKIQGMSATERMRFNGIPYITPFLKMSWPFIIYLVGSLLIRPTYEKGLLVSIPVSMLIYTVYVGGDAFPFWRFVAPFVPFAFLALLLDFPVADRALRRSLGGSKLATLTRYWAFVLIVGVMFFTIARPPLFSTYINIFKSPQQDDVANINTAIYLNKILDVNESVGVFYAGSIPFYTGRYSFDFLGKTDPYIANLIPDVSGLVSWMGCKSVPGHNKYDLEYSILRKRPTYVQGLKWGRQDVSTRASEYYREVPIEFTTLPFYNTQCILLSKNSRFIKNDAGLVTHRVK